jgi:hypothetical protein
MRGRRRTSDGLKMLCAAWRYVRRTVQHEMEKQEFAERMNGRKEQESSYGVI